MERQHTRGESVAHERPDPAEDVLMIERPEGWPKAAGRFFLVLGAATLIRALTLGDVPHVRGQVDLRAYWLEVSILSLLSALLLLRWRRGALIQVAGRATMVRWWGIALTGRPIIVRTSPPRSLEGYTGVRVVQSDQTEHYKRFRHTVYHVQLEKSESVGGQLALRERIIVDDEIRNPADAGQTGRRLADFLSLHLIDRTAC